MLGFYIFKEFFGCTFLLVQGYNLRNKNKSGFCKVGPRVSSQPFAHSLNLLLNSSKLFLILLLIAWAPLLNAQTPPTGFSSTVMSSQWTEAVGLTFNKDGDQMFVWERGGRVYMVENNQKKLFIDISEEVAAYRDLGLLGFALHPQFDTNGYFYLLYNVDRHHLLYYGTSNYSSTADEYLNATIGRLTRYTATKTTGGYTISNRQVMIGATKTTGIPMPNYNHGVGTLLFGADGTLLVSAGDGASNVVGTKTESYNAQAL